MADQPDLMTSLEGYLNDPKNQALLAAHARRATSQTAQVESKPIQLGSPKTSHHVPLLYTLCQKRGIVPKFDIEGNQFGFGGRLQIGDEIISRDERWSTKKEAREELAERGVEVVKSMQERAKEPAVGPGTSWVGLLLGMLTRLSGSSFHIKNLQRNLDRYVLLIILPTEFHTSIADGGGPSYTEYAVGTGFACTCTIPLSPDAFGSTSESFPTKKAARANAAREAMKYLIDHGHTNSDGSVKSKKKSKLGTAVKVDEKKLEVKRDTTYAQRVNGKSLLLALMTFVCCLLSSSSQPY